MLISIVCRNFSRLLKPKIFKYPNIQTLMRDKSDNLKILEHFNHKILHTNKNHTFEKQLTEEYGLNKETAVGILKGGYTVHQIAYDAITHKGYRISQKLAQQQGIQIDDLTDDVQIPYSPNKNHLKFHPSINNHVPIIQDYPIDNRTAYIFNLPHNITEKDIMFELGFRFVKSVTIKYCMMGLPAYAIAQFISQNSLTDKIMTHQLQITLNNRSCPIITHIEPSKLSLAHRQIVLHDINQYYTPVKLLKYLSKYGRVINLSYPHTIYKQPTIQDIKKLYKDSQYPVRINHHRLNGTIQSQFYPEYRPSSEQLDQRQMKVQQNQWRMNFCEEVEVYEKSQEQKHSVKVKNKGYCVVTYACVQQAQNCYFRERLYRKCELTHNKQEFQFDQSHRQQLLRYIDHQYIESNKINKSKTQQFNNQLFQNFYQKMTIQNLTEKFYAKAEHFLENPKPEIQQFLIFHQYKNRLEDLRLTIGLQSNPISTEDLEHVQNRKQKQPHGKTFSELAEEYLYGRKLHKQKSQERYTVTIDKYMYDEAKAEQLNNKQMHRKIEKAKLKQMQKIQAKYVGNYKAGDDDHDFQENLRVEEQKMKTQGIFYDDKGTLAEGEEGDDQLYISSPMKPKLRVFQPLHHKFYDTLNPKRYKGTPPQQQNQQEQEDIVESDEIQVVDDSQIIHKGKHKFSTLAIKDYYTQNFRSKTLQQTVKSHIRYNQFVRNTINQYMGVFSSQKLESQFGSKKPTYTNPHKLQFNDGTQFLPDCSTQIKRILQFSTDPSNQCQELLSFYMKQNQIIKSLSLDVQEKVLKNLHSNAVESMFLMSDKGYIKEEFSISQENNQTPEEIVRQLNLNQAEFGEEYQLIKNSQKNQNIIAKVVKLENIVPLELSGAVEKIMRNSKIQQQFTSRQLQLFEKYQQKLVDGQQIPEQLCKQFNMPEKSIFSEQILMQEMKKQLQKHTKQPLSNKNLQKLMNLENYTKQQIAQDLGRQSMIEEYRGKFRGNKASDYGKDPATIYVKDKEGKFRVSKFRQI